MDESDARGGRGRRGSRARAHPIWRDAHRFAGLTPRVPRQPLADGPACRSSDHSPRRPCRRASLPTTEEQPEDQSKSVAAADRPAVGALTARSFAVRVRSARRRPVVSLPLMSCPCPVRDLRRAAGAPGWRRTPATAGFVARLGASPAPARASRPSPSRSPATRIWPSPGASREASSPARDAPRRRRSGCAPPRDRARRTRAGAA